MRAGKSIACSFALASVAGALQMGHGEEPKAKIAPCKYVCSQWKQLEFDLLKKRGFDPKHVLDIGANDGDWTRFVAQIFPDADYMMVDACETDHWEDILATGRATGYVAILNDGKDMARPAIYCAEKAPKFAGDMRFYSQFRTLDRLLNETGNSQVKWDFMKLDVENWELEVLKGASEVLKNVEVIQIELPFGGSYKNTFAEYVAVMDNLGFAPLGMPEQHRSPAWGDVLTQIDIIYVKKDSPIMKDRPAP